MFEDSENLALVLKTEVFLVLIAAKIDDSVGGEAFLAYSASVLFPVPNAPVTWPLRFQAFVNAGSLLPLDQGEFRGVCS
jgi:outer membrane protein assembly factor BamA